MPCRLPISINIGKLGDRFRRSAADTPTAKASQIVNRRRFHGVAEIEEAAGGPNPRLTGNLPGWLLKKLM
jgi:hypothetical protein